MKKVLSIILAGFICMNTATAQDRAMSQGKSSVNVFYGVNLLTSFYKGLASSTASDVKVTGVGPVGIMYEYMVTDGVGLGAEVSYASTTLSYKEQDTDYSTGVVSTYDWKVKFATTRAFFRANFHFTKSEKFDAYALIAAGYRGSSFTIETNHPGGADDFKVGNFVPFGFKPGVGFRYFFTDNVGINLELAIGTPAMGGGLSFKF